MNFKSLFFILCFFSCSLTASANFSFNARCIEAYKAIFDFRLNDARALIRDEKLQNPQNGITILLDNYVDYIGLLTSENKADYDRLKDVKSDRIDALEKNDENSPYYLYAQAEVYLQWGLLKGRFGDYMSSARDIKKAKNLLSDNAGKFPNFLPDQKCLDLINVVFGALPSNLKGIAKFLGMDGNTQAGIAQLEKLRYQVKNTPYSFYNDEIIFFLCYLDIDVLHDSNNYNKLLAYLGGMDNKNALLAYLKGYAAAKTAHNDDAINYLLAIPSTSQYTSMPAIDYLLGCAKLCRMDSDAYLFFNKYINEYKGVNYIKDSYLKLAYFYLLKSDGARYNYYLGQVRSKGYAIDEKDKQALKEANDTRPDIDLLKTRLYFDGGYFNRALVQLKDKQEGSFKLLRDKIEFDYRLGRIYEKLSRYNDAIASYQKAINIGKATTYYFAANAALCIGGIYEHIQDDNQAANYYNQAIDMKNHEYESSISNQAKDGLQRIHR
jgi:hypothetical protein